MSLYKRCVAKKCVALKIMSEAAFCLGLAVDRVFDLLFDIVCKCSNFNGTFIAFALFSYRNLATFGFFLAYDEQIGDAFEFVIADFAADFFVAVVDGYANVESLELLGHLVSVVVEFL